MTRGRAPEWNCALSLGETAWVGIASIQLRSIVRVSRACNAPSARSKAISGTALPSDRVRPSFLSRVSHHGVPHPLIALLPEWASWPLAGGAHHRRASRSLPCRLQVDLLLYCACVHQVEIQLQFF